jgi:hypothetical protein
MSTPRFPRSAVAALFLERQHLGRPSARRFTAANVARFARDVGGVQLDSINVVDRAHHLTLWSRFGPFDRDRLDRMVYRDRRLFEYWSHAACLVAAEDFPACRRAMLDYTPRNKAWGAWLRKHEPTLRIVEDEIRARGPLGSADFLESPRGGAGWWNWKPAAHALDYLWMSGVITTHSRRHFQKKYDLTERTLGEAMQLEPYSREAYRAWHLERSLHAMGAATETDLRMYLTFPRDPAASRRAQLRAATGNGEVVEIQVDGLKGSWFVLHRDLGELERAARAPTTPRGTTFLSPFDSFLWHRERTSALFDFDYRIEVYVPEPKRRYGYYVLPLLHDGRFIGRADVKTHRKERTLEIRAMHFEPWFARDAAAPLGEWEPVEREVALAGAARSMRSLAAFVGAEKVALSRVAPGRMRSELARALRNAPPVTPQSQVAPEEDEP